MKLKKLMKVLPDSQLVVLNDLAPAEADVQVYAGKVENIPEALLEYQVLGVYTLRSQDNQIMIDLYR